MELQKPSIDDFTNSTHNHSNSVGGGTISHTSLTDKGTNTHAQIDTDLSRLANTSGTNTGDQNLSTYATKTGTENLQNKTLDNTNTVNLKDTLFSLVDDGDTTKKGIFEASGITTATTRTYTLPNGSGTITLTAMSQTLTNKSINATNNTISDTGAVSGDILMHNGTKFVKQTPTLDNIGQGTNNKFLSSTQYTDLTDGGDTTLHYHSSNSIYTDQSGGTTDTYGVLSGTINGSNKVFTVSQNVYISGSLRVYLNGQLQTQGTAEDWTETTPASGTFTFVNAPLTGDLITVVYMKSGGGTLNSDTLDGQHGSYYENLTNIAIRRSWFI